MKIKALKAFTVRDSETGDLSSIAYGAIADVSDTLGQSLIEDGLAEAYDDGSNDENFKKAVDKSITRVTADMLEGVTNIRKYAFDYCNSLTSIEIPNSVTSIGDCAFENCQELHSVEIPNSVTSIGGGAFASCYDLKSIEIPSSVAEIGGGTFFDCYSLTSVTVLATTPPTLGSGMLDDANNAKIYVPAESVEAYKAATNWSDYASKIQAIPS